MSHGLHPRDAHNQVLLENARPPGWKNPTPAPRYNMVVIGGGTAGLVSAAGAAMLGARVALIERSLMGGDCLNTGCVPSKAILRSSRISGELLRAPGLGYRVDGRVEADFSAIMERMRRIRARISHHDSVKRFSDLGIDIFLGEGRFSGPDSVDVDGKRLRFRRAVIATGTRPAIPAVHGLEEAGYLTSDTVWSLTELPPSMAVIGAGPIGCELAQAFRRFGSEVTLLGRSPRLLRRDDPDASESLARAFQKDGIRTILGCRVDRIMRQGAGHLVRVSRDGTPLEITAGALLVTAGRVPSIERLSLEKAGVESDETGVTVSDGMRTSNPRIFAAGDVCMDQKFTHAADVAARIVIQNSLFLGRKKLSAATIPWTTYTDPEVAHVGITASEAAGHPGEIMTLVRRFEEVDRAIADGEEDGFVKVHARRRGGRVLGATIVAPHAGEMIGEMVLAMKSGADLGTLAGVVHPYPTRAEAIRQLADEHNREKLTPLVRKILGGWLRWTRR